MTAPTLAERVDDAVHRLYAKWRSHIQVEDADAAELISQLWAECTSLRAALQEAQKVIAEIDSNCQLHGCVPSLRERIDAAIERGEKT